MRAMKPVCTAVSESAGSARLRSQPRMLTEGGTYPPAGNQPSPTARPKISISPSQNSGTDRPISARLIIDWSAQPPCRVAAITPAEMPSSSASSSASAVSDSVTGRRSTMALATLLFSRIDWPRLPCRMRPYQPSICTMNGLSSPS